MRDIYICEDSKEQLSYLKEYIENYTCIEDYDMQVKLATNNPDKVIKNIITNKTKRGIYFLDINLNHNINGLQLGQEIRSLDEFAIIIIITTHNEMATVTFDYKIEAMDFISKDDKKIMRAKIKNCLDLISLRDHKSKDEEIFKFEDGEKIRNIDISDIMFFETSNKPHRILIHLFNGRIEIYGSISEIAEQNENFIRCHESVAVNKKNIVEINKRKKEVLLRNGMIAKASSRLIKNLY